MARLQPRLLALRPGTRVVSHHFTLGDWEPDESVRVEERSGYLWVVPADARGCWTLAGSGDGLELRIRQVRQMLTVDGERAGRPVPVFNARVRGSEIRFSTFDADGNSRIYSGRIEARRMSGSSEGQDLPTLPWSAERR